MNVPGNAALTPLPGDQVQGLLVLALVGAVLLAAALGAIACIQLLELWPRTAPRRRLARPWVIWAPQATRRDAVTKPWTRR